MMAFLTTKAEYMTLTRKLKEDTWLKGLFVESGFELRLVAGIVTCALTKVVPNPEVPTLVEAAAYLRRLTIITKVEIVRILVYNS
ncbi:hypothetical protein Tco_1180050 [Tanacetum coccineum]